jgi:hypothetical protein
LVRWLRTATKRKDKQCDEEKTPHSGPRGSRGCENPGQELATLAPVKNFNKSGDSRLSSCVSLNQLLASAHVHPCLKNENRPDKLPL